MPDVIFITSPLEAEHVARMRAAVPAGVEIIHDPDLLPPQRYVADHGGVPGFKRTPEQQARWQAHLARATILWGFPSGKPEDGGGLALAPNVTWVQTTSSGVGQLVARLGLVDTDLLVTTARGVHALPLAEFAMLGLLMHTKRLAYLQAEQKAHRWERYCGVSPNGQTMLVLGAGTVGAATGRLAKAFGMTVIAVVNRPSQDRKAELSADEVYGSDRLAEVIGRADCVTVCVPHTPSTEGMVSREIIAAMKPGAAFVNVARGQVVDEIALIEALKSGHVGFAALDVAMVEPLPKDSPLWDMDNVLISPHSASTVAAENGKITDIFIHNLKAHFAGDRAGMINVLNKSEMY